MKTRALIVSSTAVAVVAALALLLRPSQTIHRGPEMAAPGRIPPAARAVISSKMRRHAEQLPALLMAVVVLDYDGVARAAGEMFDEPVLARPLTGDELNGLLPERFFQLQDELRVRVRQVVVAAAQRDGNRLSASFGELTRTCVACHAVYLSGATP
jgi:hypothetical protein